MAIEIDGLVLVRSFVGRWSIGALSKWTGVSVCLQIASGRVREDYQKYSRRVQWP